jgi:FlaA1/EpsC-like NDP-sugar epimerase
VGKIVNSTRRPRDHNDILSTKLAQVTPSELIAQACNLSTKMTDSPIVLITGGNTGIGYESVKALYASPHPHTILMGSRSLEKANESISRLKNEVSGSKSELVPIQIDIEDDASIEKAFGEVESKYGRVDTLVNNAGNFLPFLRRDDNLIHGRWIIRRHHARRS